MSAKENPGFAPGISSGQGGNETTKSSDFSIKVPSLSLPKGGGAIKGIGEKFAANPVTGTGSMTVPLATSPGRSGFGPQLSLSYDSGSGNGPFGFGWNLSLPAITRKTDKGLPKYQDEIESDVFILSGAEDLVPVMIEEAGTWEPEPARDYKLANIAYRIKKYRPRIEGLFARIERWTNINDSSDIVWRSISKDNITTWYGRTENSRIQFRQNGKTRVFSWLISQSYDDKGNAITYEYEPENDNGVDLTQINEKNRLRTANRYLKRVKYGNLNPNRDNTWTATDPARLEKWLFEIVFDYGDGHYNDIPFDAGKPETEQNRYVTADISGEKNVYGRDWRARKDSFSSYRSGFEIRTHRLCRRVLMFHHFNELPCKDYLVRSTEFIYNESNIASFITSMIQSGYQWIENNKFLKKTMPAIDFEYSQAEISSDIKTLVSDNLPAGIDGKHYQLIDLDGEGLSGILTDQGNSWYYKANLGDGKFDSLKPVEKIPSPGSLSGDQQLLDLSGDGQLDLVCFKSPLPGFFERTENEDWEPFKPFRTIPGINWNDPNLRFIDLNGDGHADILITEDDVFLSYQSLAEDGFADPSQVYKELEEEKGPALVFNDGTQSVYLSDMSGDGLTDLVRVRNGEICYWPNLGYGHFGPKVVMDDSPVFDFPDLFSQDRIRLADVDGSGITDIIYLRNDGVYIYLNESGNSWHSAIKLNSFPQYDNLSTVMAADLMGNGTACLLWSSPLPSDCGASLKYIDLMGGQKPHLLKRVINNLGAETHVSYTSSTKFYLADKKTGNPWITRIPFPVHVVEKVETFDKTSNNRFVTRYAYHHGYFDGFEREFRGFGMVEQWDTEEYNFDNTPLPTASDIDKTSYVPPVHTRTWFHTGANPDRAKISRKFEHEYFKEPGLNAEESGELLLPDTVLPDKLSIYEECEACRALKGSILRLEIYADDNSPKSAIPYSVSERNYTIKRLQPSGNNRHAVFFVHPNETIDYQYERNSDDPRISHQLTLEVDDYGNVKKSVTAGYGRREEQVELIKQKIRDKDPEYKGLEEEDLLKQSQVLITFTEAAFTNPIDRETDNWRTPLSAEIKTYELTGYALSGKYRYKPGDFIKTVNEKAELICDEEILYEDKTDESKRQKRLIEHVKTIYRKNNLTGFCEKGKLESMALPGESYKLAFTRSLLDSIYSIQKNNVSKENLIPDPQRLLGGKSGCQGGYTDSDGDGNWWISSGRIFYDNNADPADPVKTAANELATARMSFFLPSKYSDPFDNVTTIDYDDSNFLMIKVTDPVKNSVESLNDYRVLQPGQIKDPNKNCTRVIFDALGMVTGTAVMGKINNAGISTEGDTLDGFEPNLTDIQIEEFLRNPREADLNTTSESKPTEITKNLLRNATTRIVYNLSCFKKSGIPPFAAIISREIHFRDLKAGEQSKLQVSFSYSDGFGREIQKKIQAEAGKAPKRGTNTKIIVKPDGQPEWTDKEIRPRWVGSGWTIFNNKGKPVRQFEPFFSDTHLFDPDIKIGVSPVLFYDPLDRVIATLYPNHTFEKVLFDAWMQKTYDVNDTITFDPRTDIDIAGYLKEFFKNEAPDPDDWKTWLQGRDIDPINPPGDMQTTDPEKKAAIRVLVHGDTPATVYLDNLGRPFLTIAHNKYYRNSDEQKTLYDETHATRVELDIEGNQRIIRDAFDRNIMIYQYDMLNNPCSSDSIDAGKRWMLKNVSGNNLCRWNIRDGVTSLNSTGYDALQRQTKVIARHGNAPELHHEYIIYGESHPAAEKLNLRGKVFMGLDSSGVLINHNEDADKSYDFKGNLLYNCRKLAREYKTTPDWKSLESLLFAGTIDISKISNEIGKLTETGRFETSISYDALNRRVQSVLPDKTIVKSVFNEANLLDKIDAKILGKGNFSSFIQNTNYDSKGQREKILYGNNTVTEYTYDNKTYRLIRLVTRKTESSPDGRHLQDLNYTYDPVGNIIKIQDDAQQTHYFANAVVEPHGLYEYDSIYRLISATGREHAGADSNSQPDHTELPFINSLPHLNDSNALRNYTETYYYDYVGNIRGIKHKDNKNGIIWNRRYRYDEKGTERPPTNRLFSTSAAGDPVEGPYSDRYEHDENGNMIKMPHLGYLKWDFKDQLQEVDLRGGGKAWYVYDANGQRIRKVIERNGGKKEQRIYLGNVELYGTGQDLINPDLLRWTTFISDDKGKIAQADTKILDKKNDDKVNPLDVSLIRYQYSNHLGSAILETNDAGDVISYEEYHPYGTTAYHSSKSDVDLSLKRYRYSGKERDEETGLYYYGKRYHIPNLGNWLSPDPAYFIDGVNLYTFVNNNPVVLNDYRGEETYILSHTSSNASSIAAQTRQKEIESNKNFNSSKDHVFLIEIDNLGDLKNQIEKVVEESREKGYGETVEFAFWGHGGVDGPQGVFRGWSNSTPTTEDTETTDEERRMIRERGMEFQLIPRRWSAIDFNWNKEKSIAAFYHCQSSEFAQQFLTYQPGVKGTVGGEGTAYPSVSGNRRVFNHDSFWSEVGTDIYYAGGGSDEMWKDKKSLYYVYTDDLFFDSEKKTLTLFQRNRVPKKLYSNASSSDLEEQKSSNNNFTKKVLSEYEFFETFMGVPVFSLPWF